jgi:phosphatidylglycerophosphate synthase
MQRSSEGARREKRVSQTNQEEGLLIGEPSTPPGAKQRDYWWTVIATDPIALPLVRLLVRKRWLTPNQVTALGLCFGLSVGVAFSFGTRAGLIAGGILFYLAFMFDCIDGKLARTLGVHSALGDGLDHLADGGRRASGSLGIIIYLWRAGGVGDNAFMWGVVYAILAYYFIEISGARKNEPVTKAGARWSGALAERRLLPTPGMPDVQAAAFILGPITGFVVPGLGLGIAMLLAAIVITARRRVRG